MHSQLPHHLPPTLQLLFLFQPSLFQHALEGCKTEGADPETAIVSNVFTRYVARAALATEHLATHPAMVSPSEGGKLGCTLIALQGDIIWHPVLSQTCLRVSVVK